ncbi:hypothetical protein I312_105557 [Cryptococcus bacillisporus CA1280]|uniref:uncharacterized protein n=1 Tax=Cryptococcus bacillisporus CA1280 TaxID=1296109 RepID=UPI003369772A
MSAQDHLDSPGLRSPSAEIDEPTSQRKPSGGQKHTQVKRATVACSACRARKIKCSGDKPICTTCAKGSVQCEYPVVRKRKREGTKKDSGSDRLDSALAAPLFTQTSNIPEPTVGSSSFDSNPFAPPFNIFTVTPQHASTSFVAHPIPDWAQSPWGNLTAGDVGGHGMGNVDQSALDMPSWDMGAKAPSRTESAAGIHTSASDIDSGQMWENTSNTSNVDRRSGAHPKARFRVPYFRFFGPTAIAPGYKQVVCDVSAPGSPIRVPPALPWDPMLQSDQTIMASDGESPSIDALKELLPVFRLHFGYFFPFLDLSIDDQGFLASCPPPHLLNIVCALAARYSQVYGMQPILGCADTGSPREIWASKAKGQVARNLAVASIEMVQTLLLISWYEFSQDRDGGLWMYSGMALRMGQDLGLDTFENQTPSSDNPDQDAHQSLRCALFMMDAIMSIGTGRAGMYKTSLDEVPSLPALTTPSGHTLTNPYPYMTRIFCLADRVTRILVDKCTTTIDEVALEQAQSQLNEFHTSLPVDLRFETFTFQKYAAIAQGGAFVLLNLWFHTLIVLVYRPSLLVSPIPNGSRQQDGVAGKEVSASSAKTILDIAIFAELIDPKAITQPWINYPLYIAARTFLSQIAPGQSKQPADSTAGEVHITKTARANFQRIIGVFDGLQPYWNGVRYIRSVLLQKAEGVSQVSLIDGGDDIMSPDTLPPELAAILAGMANDRRPDVLGMGLTGTMNSPTDNLCSLVLGTGTVGQGTSSKSN